MNRKKRFVETPRVEIGSPQYLADAANMKLFDSYEDYLEFQAVWQSGWTSYHPSTAPTVTYSVDFLRELDPDLAQLFSGYESYLETLMAYYGREVFHSNNFLSDDFPVESIRTYEEYLGYLEYCRSTLVVCSDCASGKGYLSKDKSAAIRRNSAAKACRRNEMLFEVSHRKLSDSSRDKHVSYKRGRFLQPQCIAMARVFINSNGNDVAVKPWGPSHAYVILPGYDLCGDFDICSDDYDLELIGLRVSEQPEKYRKRSKQRPAISEGHAEGLYELSLIMSAMPGVSKKTAQKFLQRIYKYLEDNEAKLPKQSFLDYLCFLIRPELKKFALDNSKLASLSKDLLAKLYKIYEVDSLSKALLTKNYDAYMEVLQLVKAVISAVAEESGDYEEAGEDESDASGSKLIPTSDFFPKAPDANSDSNRISAHSGTYANRRHACVVSAPQVLKSQLKATPDSVVPVYTFIPACAHVRNYA